MYLHRPKDTPTKSQTNEEYLFEKKSVLLCIGRKQAKRIFNIKKYNNQSFFIKLSLSNLIESEITIVKNKIKPTMPVSDNNCIEILWG
jgi:hypothetical protein